MAERERVRNIDQVLTHDWAPKNAKRADLIRARAMAGEMSLPQVRTEVLEMIKAESPNGPGIVGVISTASTRSRWKP